MGSAREVSVMSRYIDADAMKEWIDEYVSVFKKSDNKDIKGYIEHQPTIEAVPKEFHDKTCEAMAKRHQEEIADRPRGKWIDEADKYDASFGIHDYRCSNCNCYADEYIGGHEWYTAGKPNFCPHCGARMFAKDINVPNKEGVEE